MQDIFKGKLFLTNRMLLIGGFFITTTLFIRNTKLSTIALLLHLIR